MNFEGKNNHLILGASSNIAAEYIALNGVDENNFFGLSTKDNYKNLKMLNKSVGYSNIKYFSNIKFNKIFIISSRNPSDGGDLSEFIEVNKTIENIISNINFSVAQKPQIIFLSSFSVYDKQLAHISDTTETSPADNYGESKLLLEGKLIKFSKNNDIDLLILRLPVFLYNQVGLSSSNFLAKLSLSIKLKQSFHMSNPESCLGAVFDMPSLVKLCSKKLSGINIINCASNPDMTFFEIGEEAIKYGLEKVDWIVNDRPSVEICLNKINQILGYEPSAKKIIKNWMSTEFKI